MKKADSAYCVMGEIVSDSPHRFVRIMHSLASIGKADQMLVSERYFSRVQNERALYSCGCQNGAYTGQRSHLWTEVSVADKPYFDFLTAWSCASYWCKMHGADAVVVDGR